MSSYNENSIQAELELEYEAFVGKASQDAKNLLFQMAWDKCHDQSLQAVADEYDSLVELVAQFM